MSYQVKTSRSSEKDLRRLTPELKARVIVALRALAEDPRPANVRKLVGEENAYRIRVGDYRAVYEVNDAERRILVLRVKHRREVYRG